MCVNCTGEDDAETHRDAIEFGAALHEYVETTTPDDAEDENNTSNTN